MSDKRPVVVTTEMRGVFFGYVEDDSKLPNELVISQARMCVYWNVETRGVLGLAGLGPKEGCKVTHAIPKITLYKVSSVMDASPEATEAWEKSLWK